MSTILPWHDPLWQQMQRRWQQNRLPHALLLSGPQGMGKAIFAERLAEMWLCDKPLLAEGKPCGQCKSCHLFQAETHPDLFKVQPAESGKPITI